MSVPTILRQTSTRRTTPLSEGVKLCGIILSICAVPLLKVTGWIAAWLLVVMSVVGLGTFAVWVFKTLTGKSEPTEEHTENMAAISLLGQNRDGQQAIIEIVPNEPPVENPALDQRGQK